MPATVKLNDLLDAFLWVSADGLDEHGAYVSRETGKVHWTGGDGSLDEDEEAPADLDDEDRYVPVPDKRELHLGKRLALRFIKEHAPHALERAHIHFSKAGAYGRFKALLDDIGMLDAWYKYEEKAVHEALRQWAQDNDLDVTEDRNPGHADAA